MKEKRECVAAGFDERALSHVKSEVKEQRSSFFFVGTHVRGGRAAERCGGGERGGRG